MPKEKATTLKITTRKSPAKSIAKATTKATAKPNAKVTPRKKRSTASKTTSPATAKASAKTTAVTSESKRLRPTADKAVAAKKTPPSRRANRTMAASAKPKQPAKLGGGFNYTGAAFLSGVITVAVAVVGALFLLTLGFNQALELKQDKRADFNRDKIVLDNKAELVANFIEINKPQDFSFTFTAYNYTKYDYQLVLDGRVAEHGSELGKTPAFILPAHSSKEIQLVIPLAFVVDEGKDLPQELKQQTELVLNLSSQITPSNILGESSADIQYAKAITLQLAKDSELAQLSVAAGQNYIEVGPNRKPDLNYTISLANLVQAPQGPAIYEAFLTTKDKQRIQPLLVKDISLLAGEKVAVKEVFKFETPPVNQFAPGEKEYLIEIVYKGNVGTRQFELKSYTPTPIKIKSL